MNSSLGYGRVLNEDLKESPPTDKNGAKLYGEKDNKGKLSNLKWEKYGSTTKKLADTT